MKRSSILVLLVLASLILAACGGGGAATTPASPGGTSTSVAPAGQATASGGTGMATTAATTATGAGTSPTAAATIAATSAPAVEPTGAATAATQATTGQATAQPTAQPTATAAAGTGGAGAAAGGDGPTFNSEVSGEVELWHFWASPVRRNAIRRVIAICQQQLPNIKVTDTVKPFGDIWTANLAAVAGGSGMPDVIVSDRPTLPRDAADGVYMSLQEWADRDGVTRDQFYDWAWDQALYENEIYGIPHETDVTVLFYNKNLFQQAGLDPNKPPTTWEEVEQYADKLDKMGANGELQVVGFFPLWNRGTDVWQYTNDAAMIADDGTLQINNPKMVETVEWMKSWVDRYGGWEKLQSFRNQFGAPPNDIFMSSAVAMYADIYGYNSALQFYRPSVKLENGETPRMDWGIALLPYKTEPGTWSGGFSLSIPSGAANAEAAWEFIKCATGAEGQASWARDTQAQPTNLKAATDPVLLADPSWAVVDEALKTSTGGVYLPAYPNWAEQLTQRWEKVWLGELSAQEMLDQVQEAVEAAQ